MSQKVVAQGGSGGYCWNDGIFDGVKKVIVGRDDYCVTFVKFKYVKDSAVEVHKHGVVNQTPQESSWPKKLDAQGGPGGGTWDDGDNNDIRKIYVGKDEACVTAIKFEYVRDGIQKTKAYGIEKEELQEFLLDPNEYIISVEGTYGTVHRFGSRVITSLTFTTSKGRTSLTFGATKFVLEDNGRELVGFHGRSDRALDAIGAYFALPK
ncbi:unnamed protein product [Arabidopsis thaliana]|uniref:(thale cress) hypothetical protein n=1 Tax=Arabidopsis thaliana TaxID=3702 RepID=A0A7G2DZ61_ARATH|nr:unnamed protein product [Arabidopsis thaliana]